MYVRDWCTVAACHSYAEMLNGLLGNRLKQGGHKPGKPGIVRDFSECGKLREFSGNSVQPQGKIVTNKVFLVCHLNISVKQLLTG